MSKTIEAAEARGTAALKQITKEERLQLEISRLKAYVRELRATLKLRNRDCNNLRAANEAKHREIADMDRRHVDALYSLRCHIREPGGQCDE